MSLGCSSVFELTLSLKFADCNFFGDFSPAVVFHVSVFKVFAKLFIKAFVLLYFFHKTSNRDFKMQALLRWPEVHTHNM